MKKLLLLIIQNIESFEKKDLKFRKGQKPFFDAIVEGLKKGWRTMYIEGPTGMGKTFIEAVIAAAIIGSSNMKILLLTSKITLLKQIQLEFAKFVGFLATGLVGGGFKDYSQQVTIMTYDSFRNLDEDIAKQFKVLLLDEGHKALGKKTKAKLERQKKFSILIGFTASATYSVKKSLEKFLKNPAYKLSIIEAVELGMLSNIKVMVASVDIEIDNQQQGESKGEYEERISAEIIREGGNIATARLYKRVFAKRNLRGITLVLTTKQGLDLVNEFESEGIKAELIHSKMKRAEREDMFKRFRKHEFDVLVGMGIIKEGFDDPGVSVAITTYPVSSIVDMTQFPGRAERIDEDNPDKVAYIVNLAYKTKKQRFYSEILDGKTEVRQKKKRKKKGEDEEEPDIIPNEEFDPVPEELDSVITAIAVTEEEVRTVIRDTQGLSAYSQEELIELAKEKLEQHGISDRAGLLKKGPSQFTKLDCGPFGQGIAFTSWLLPDLEVTHITIEILEAIATRLNWTDRVKTDERALLELADKGITDRISLLKKGYGFVKLDFGPFGKGIAFANWLLPDFEVKRVTTEILETIAVRLGWTDRVKTDERALLELASNGITNRVLLFEKGPKEFIKLDFGPFGKGKAFAKWLLPDLKFRNVTTEILEAIAVRLGWTDRVKTDERALLELANNGITDRVSLLKKGPVKFIKLDFGPFGKGLAFARWLLPDLEIKRITIEILEAIAVRLGWTDRVKTDERALLELANKGITNRVSLLKKGSFEFTKLDFGPFGKGHAFANWLLPDLEIKHVTTEILEAIAVRLGWTDVLDDERALLELVNKGITNRVSLLKKRPAEFTKLDFGPFGKGHAFAKWLLPDLEIKHVTTEILEAIATRLGWYDE